MPLLFSYGTLQQDAVQLSTFGRLLHGQPDQLVGFEQSLLKIEDPEFVATSGKAHHAIVRFNGKTDSRVNGTVFELSEGELASADRYEPAGYKRISTKLASGKQAWVYAAAPNVQQAVPFFNVTDINKPFVGNQQSATKVQRRGKLSHLLKLAFAVNDSCMFLKVE